MPAFVAPALATTANNPSPPSASRVRRSASPVSRPCSSAGTSSTPTSITRAAAATDEWTVSQAANRQRVGRVSVGGRRVPRGHERRQVPGRATAHEHAARVGGHARRVRQPCQRLVLRPDRARAVDPARRDRRGRAHDQVEQHARLRRGARHERERRRMVGGDRRGSQHLAPETERLLPADPRGRHGRAGAFVQLGGGHHVVQRLRGGDPVPRVRHERPGHLLGLVGVLVHELHRGTSPQSRSFTSGYAFFTRGKRKAGPKAGPPRLVATRGRERYFESSWQNSPNASTYFAMSSSVCCTEIVHCSSSPGVMKMPRFTIHG